MGTSVQWSLAILPLVLMACTQSNLRGERIKFADAIWWRGSTNANGQGISFLLTTVPDACATYFDLGRTNRGEPIAPQDDAGLDFYIDSWNRSMPSYLTEVWLGTRVDDIDALSGLTSTIGYPLDYRAEFQPSALWLQDIIASPDATWQPSMGAEDGYMEYAEAHYGTFEITRQVDDSISGKVDTDLYNPGVDMDSLDDLVLRGHINERFTATYCPAMED